MVQTPAISHRSSAIKWRTKEREALALSKQEGISAKDQAGIVDRAHTYSQHALKYERLDSFDPTFAERVNEKIRHQQNLATIQAKDPGGISQA